MSKVRAYRVAGGAIPKEMDAPVITLAFKDRHAPGGGGIDGPFGLMQAGGTPWDSQIGEYGEEIWEVEPDSLDSETLHAEAADIIQGTPVEQRIRDFYAAAREAQTETDGVTPVPPELGIEFVDSRFTVPTADALARHNGRIIEMGYNRGTGDGEWQTGVIEQPPLSDDDIWSEERIGYVETAGSEETVPYDMEFLEEFDEYLNRIDLRLNVATMDTRAYRPEHTMETGDPIFDGDFPEFMEFVRSNVADDPYRFEENDDGAAVYETPFNRKTDTAVRGIPGTDPHPDLLAYTPEP